MKYSIMTLMDFTTRYGKLNAAQKQAVDTIDGPVMVIAGPGTGKTELLSMRAANILQKTDTLPENILCLTFTDSGAAAMRERLVQIIGPSAYRVAIHTFHSFGSEIINHNGEFFYHGANFRAADELSSYEILRTIFDGLEYDNPLAGKMNGEYTHLGDTLSVISELKKSGLTSDELLAVCDANDTVIDAAEHLLAEVFAARLSKATIEQLVPLTGQIRQSGGEVTLPGITPLSTVLADSLQTAISEAEAANSTKPITAWRNAWMKKDEAGKFVLKSRGRQAKLRAVSYVYCQYLSRMQEAQLYDFDDMILRVVHAMEVFPELRYNLQEKYQYVMIDEFQDTNLAQMRILHNLTSSEINEGRPNVLVVGDDDQAIYSFQGADVGNINAFRTLYRDVTIIPLVDNYRSAETVLTHARSVITQGQERLENLIPGLNKTLTPHAPEEGSSVRLVELPTAGDEREWLAETIANDIKNGAAPNSIAVLARRHHELEALLPYFAKAGVKVNYERRDNVLELDAIKAIELTTRILVALYEGRFDEAEALLPEFLAHPAQNVPPQRIWQLSLAARREGKTWLEIMAVTPEFVPLQTWLVAKSQQLAHASLEIMLDEILGHVRSSQTVPSQNGFATTPARVAARGAAPTSSLEREVGADAPTGPADSDLRANSKGIGDDGSGEPTGKYDGGEFTSPFFNYYFSEANLRAHPDAYLTHLEALRTIRQKLRDYQPNETPTLQSFLEFIRLHRQLGSAITSVRPRSEHLSGAIALMTAHKSKGLEFDTVYITGATDSAWGSGARTRGRLISYPENLPLAPAGDSPDERLRLFFVAMTRAKRQLTISYSTANDNGKNTLRAGFLAGEQWHAQEVAPKTSLEHLVAAAETAWYQPLVQTRGGSLKELLAPVLENYKLSATHLGTFLDVTRGGPHAFLMNNLLHFPQAVAPGAGYGSAVHAALQRAHSHFAATGKLRPVEDVLHDFEQCLHAQHLAEKDFHDLLQKGSDVLTAYLEARSDTFSRSQKAELNFAHQHAYLGKACLTGSLDLVDIDEENKTITVTDYKTGKPARSWTGKTEYEKIKLHKYKQQLMFYQLLVRHSRDYGNYTFEKGVLQFVEPTPGGEIIALEAHFSNEDLDRFGLLIQRVWQHIVTLDLPDISQFEPSYKGILAFEDHLIDE